MKEAAGEANVTVITIVLIGVVAAVGAVLIPRILNTVKSKSCCQELGGFVSGNYCQGVGDNGNMGWYAAGNRYYYTGLKDLGKSTLCD